MTLEGVPVGINAFSQVTGRVPGVGAVADPRERASFRVFAAGEPQVPEGHTQSQALFSPTNKPSMAQTPVSIEPSARPARVSSSTLAASAGISASWAGA